MYAIGRIGAQVFVDPVQSNHGSANFDASRVAFPPPANRRPAGVRIALLPSVAEAKLARSHGRETLAPTLSQRPEMGTVITASLVRAGIGKDSDRVRYVAECALETLTRLTRLTADAGLRIESVTHADYGWAAAADDATGGDAVCAVQVSDDDAHVRLLYVTGGEPLALRRLPIDAHATGISQAIRVFIERAATATAQQPMPLLALGDAAFRQRMKEAADIAGCGRLEPNGIIAEVRHDPVAVAAAFAGSGPRFVPPGVVAAAKGRNRRRGVCAAVAATVLLAVAGVLDAVDLRREISTVRAARTAIAADVGDAMTAREDVDLLGMTVSQLEQLRQGAPRWITLLTTLSDRLPESSRVTALGAVGDSLYLEMEGGDAAAAFEGLRGISWLIGFRAVAPIQREMRGDSQITEHFSAVALVLWSELNGSRAGAQ
jgi:hypothetical protein